MIQSHDQWLQSLFLFFLFFASVFCFETMQKHGGILMATFTSNRNQHRLKGAYALMGTMSTLTAVKVLRPRDMRNAE